MDPKHSFKGVTVRNQPYSESIDEYLEAIYRLSLKNPGGWVKNKDISLNLDVKAPSVTNMLKKLTEAKLIDWKARSGIRLTEKGRNRGKSLVQNHIILELFFERVLKIKDPEKVNQIACDLEHHMDETLAEKFSTLLGIDASLENVDNFILENKLPTHIKTRKLYAAHEVIDILDRMKEIILNEVPLSRKQVELIVENTIGKFKQPE